MDPGSAAAVLRAGAGVTSDAQRGRAAHRVGAERNGAGYGSMVSAESGEVLGRGEWPTRLPSVVSVRALAGGQVGRTWRATLADGRQVVVKQCPYPAEVEAEGLTTLAAAGVPVPEVFGAEGGTLVMQLVRGEPDWAMLGAAAAAMHRWTGHGYGWYRDNRAGRFLQRNAWADDWPTFFIENRVRPHLADPLVPASIRTRLERACEGPIQARLPERPPSSLTHGDLWRGNIVDGRWVIDPEVSYADRELDLAYMLMSTHHPLPTEFWDAYRSEWPIPPDFEPRRRVLGLHHRLLQVRHFGDSQVAAVDADLTALGW
jgi:fructosamine-3-kinase